MKDSLFELLLNLFEKTLAQLKEHHSHLKDIGFKSLEPAQTISYSDVPGAQLSTVKSAKSDSVRIFTHDEQIKLTKASYQFIMRLSAWGIATPEVLELVINQLLFSDSRFVSLQETKSTIRNTLAVMFDAEQLAFLDLLLYQKEDEWVMH